LSFVHYNGKIINTHDIVFVSFEDLVEKEFVLVKRLGYPDEVVRGPEAFNLVMQLCPSALEGRRAKYARHAWAIHNLIGHPLMQIFSWLHLPALGIKIHDATVPFPKMNETP